MGTTDQVMTMVGLGGLKAVVSLLDVSDTSMVQLALDSVEAVLKVGAKRNVDYVTVLDELEGIEGIEALQSHESDEIYTKAVAIIETYLSGEEDDEENVMPGYGQDGMFAFGVAAEKSEGGSAIERPVLGESQHQAPQFQF